MPSLEINTGLCVCVDCLLVEGQFMVWKSEDEVFEVVTVIKGVRLCLY